MPGIAGRKARLYVSTTLGGQYTLVAGLTSITLEIDGATVDDSEFGDNWGQVLAGLSTWKISASGNMRAADTNGQLAIKSALLNGTDLFAKYLPDDGTTAGIGTNGQVIPAKFTYTPAVTGGQALAIELTGSGAATPI